MASVRIRLSGEEIGFLKNVLEREEVTKEMSWNDKQHVTSLKKVFASAVEVLNAKRTLQYLQNRNTNSDDSELEEEDDD